MTEKEQNFNKIKLFLKLNADPIQKEATQLHKRHLGEKYLRSEFITKYQDNHIQILNIIADNLDSGTALIETDVFKKLGEKFAKQSVQDGLTIEEAVDGTIFLKQALWKKLQSEGLVEGLTIPDFFKLTQTIGTYIDVLTSKLAFTYHSELLYIETNVRYLAEAGRVLSTSLDYDETLNKIAFLAIPQVADWCTVDIIDAEGNINQVAIAHKDPKRIKWAKELRKRQPVEKNAQVGVANVIRTGKSEIYPEITDEMLISLSKTKKELELIRKIGLTSAMIVPLFSQKKPIGAITFVTAETKRNYTQSDLRMVEELATRASVAIENARLYKGSQEAISVRDEFISVASHELKTPVTSVKMFTQILKKHSEQIGDAKAVSHLSKMDNQINKLTELIYDLLNVSKIQAGKMEFRQTVFDFDKSIQEIISVLQQSTDTHQIIIKGETKKKVYADEERISQVINNLISNAVKYSPRSKEINVHLRTEKGNVEVSVQDFGIGMSKKHLERIFERFYRVYDANDKTFPGLGIGLYISSEIIKRHKGRLWVDSVPGKGSIFSFSIPIKNGKVSIKK